MSKRNEVVKLAKSWVGKNEADGSYKSIIDIYNSYTGKLPRGTKMNYDWEWCSCTWSALAIKLGYTDIMPIEISCGQLIEAAKKMGCWQEKDSYAALPGDAVLYDWDDNGVSDNTGWPDHIGVISKVSNGEYVVIEGNYSKAVKERTISINGRYIRGFITPKYDDNVSTNAPKTENKDVKPTTKKSNEEIAKEVIAGKWGNGAEREKKLTAAGYDYKVIQNIVNQKDQPKFSPYSVKVTTNTLRIRKGASVDTDCVGYIYGKDKGVYTIVEEANGIGAKKWGKLKSGEGWISLDYTLKVKV